MTLFTTMTLFPSNAFQDTAYPDVRNRSHLLSFYREADRVATADKNNIDYEIDCSNCEAVYLGECKQYLKSSSEEHKRSVRNCDFEKNKTAKNCWEADHNFRWGHKKVDDRESRFIPRKIKETVHSMKNPTYINEIPYHFLKFGFLTYPSS